MLDNYICGIIERESNKAMSICLFMLLRRRSQNFKENSLNGPMSGLGLELKMYLRSIEVADVLSLTPGTVVKNYFRRLAHSVKHICARFHISTRTESKSSRYA